MDISTLLVLLSVVTLVAIAVLAVAEYRLGARRADSKPPELRVTEIQLTKLDVKPGETLVLRVPEGATRPQMQRLQDTVYRGVPRGVKVLVTTTNVEFSAIRDAHNDGAIPPMSKTSKG